MQKDKIAILTTFILILGIIVGYQLLSGEEVKNPTPESKPAATSTRSVNVGEFRGISLQLHNSSPDHPFEQYVREIAQTGANSICFAINAWQENCSSTSLFIDGRKSPTDQRLRSLINLAHDLNLRVVIMPIVLLENPKPGEWRGKIAPTNWDSWWEDYTNYVMHYAYIAGETNADVFMVGSELVSTEKQEDQWRKLIARVRKHVGGLVSYSANWDHYMPVKWWDDLDMIGMTSYYELSDGEKPTLESLLEKWQAIKTELISWQSTIDRPILFTEVGWPNQVTAAKYPWNYYESPKDPDPQTQAACFEAFFQTWANEKILAGYLIWEWRNHPSQKIGPEDTSYIPCGKPAMDVIKKYFQYPNPNGEITKSSN